LAYSLWLESFEEHLPTIIAGVLRLRATSIRYATDPRGASLRMTALWEESKRTVSCAGKHEKI
jgi:hypothetical protein